MSVVVFPALCYGKLPAFGDFVRWNASSREVLVLNEWVQHGIHASKTLLGHAWDRTFESWTPKHFVFTPENSDRFLVGIMQPSRDKGQRQYPFFVSALVDRRRFSSNHAHLIPLIFSRFLDETRRLLASATNGLDVQMVLQQTQGMNASVLDAGSADEGLYDRFVYDTSLESFWANLCGSLADERKFLLFKNLNEILLPFRQRNLSRLVLGVRFPLSAEPNQARLEVCFWTQLCLAMLDAKGVIPTLFWGTSDKGSFAFLFFRQPSPKNFVHLMRSDVESDTMCLLDEEGKDKLAFAAQNLSPRFRSLLESRTITLKNFLDQVA